MNNLGFVTTRSTIVSVIAAASLLVPAPATAQDEVTSNDMRAMGRMYAGIIICSEVFPQAYRRDDDGVLAYSTRMATAYGTQEGLTPEEATNVAVVSGHRLRDSLLEMISNDQLPELRSYCDDIHASGETLGFLIRRGSHSPALGGKRS